MLAETKYRSTARVSLAGQDIEYRLRPAAHNGKLRIRVGVSGIEVLKPPSRGDDDVEAFLHANSAWVLSQLDRIARLRGVRRMRQIPAGEILFRGVPTPVHIEDVPRRELSNRVFWDGTTIVVARGRRSLTAPARTLENWLRRRARAEIQPRVITIAARLSVNPSRIYVMDQQTKWGNCSALRNLSFNWRIVMAPDPVLDYLVTHEVVHLAIPDHSQKFWLTVQSIAPDAERARQWLSANSHRLLVNLSNVVASDQAHIASVG